MGKCKITIEMDGETVSMEAERYWSTARRVIEAAEDFLQDAKGLPVPEGSNWDPRFVSDEAYEAPRAFKPAPSVSVERCARCNARTLVCRPLDGYRN